MALGGARVEQEALNHANIAAHDGLMIAFRRRDGEAARTLMAAHIAEAEDHARRIGAAYRRTLVLDQAFEAEVRLATLTPKPS